MNLTNNQSKYIFICISIVVGSVFSTFQSFGQVSPLIVNGSLKSLISCRYKSASDSRKDTDELISKEVYSFNPDGKLLECRTYYKNDIDYQESIVYDGNYNITKRMKFYPEQNSSFTDIYEYNASNVCTKQSVYDKDNVLTDLYSYKNYVEGGLKIIEIVHTDANNEFRSKEVEKYDSNNNLVESEYFNNKKSSKTISRFDSNNKLIESTSYNYNSQNIVTYKFTCVYTYNSSGIPISCIYRTNNQLKIKYQYDTEGNVSEIINFNNSGRPESTQSFVHDNKGNWIQKIEKLAGKIAYKEIRQIEYNL